jgi:transglutaminase-like putative cysteine protease
MKIRIGYELTYVCPRPTPMILMVNVHYTRVADLITPDYVLTRPAIPLSGYRDSFGNWCTRLVLPTGETRIFSEALVNDTGRPDALVPEARLTPIEALPDEVLPFLLGSRYCETDVLLPIAWQLFGNAPSGWATVQAICDFVHAHVTFGYDYARPTKTAFETYREKQGVCRDFAHLAVALCRCMNIPARYCTGYLGDIGLPASPQPMDFAGWFEAHLGGQWYTFDARHNVPRIGRVLIARGRDAADVAIATSFGENTLARFQVLTDEIRS